ncbi:MAG: sodium:solute symporter family protein [Candidatus Aminicenantes bacterium]|nr:sodium:solute symporter family protein [Candidatus Aminicenantes bacterium]MDH5705279.1 sodium:solute symporter family protein [Candidatus Aminicenantes bacterium]
MHIWGLHIIDVVVILLYVTVILWLGKRAAQKTKDTGDFFLAGRKLGKFYQFFLNFGCSTNADQAVAVSREIYRQGIGGMWIQYLVLFLTPFYWFSTLFFRRIRLTTIGDYFTERFKSKSLGGSYAVFILLLSILGGGVGYMVAAKTMMAMTPKPLEKCAYEERLSVEQFQEYQQLRSRLDEGLTQEERARYEVLNERNKRGELHSFISYTNPLLFYFIYAIIVSIYTMLGGFRAAAITDAIQGFLIIIFSLLLIPVGLHRIGGFSGLHATVPDYMFELFGSVTMSEYAWYTILAMVLANLVSIVAVTTGMQTAGSARNEMTARLGMIGGMYLKRFIMIFWALAGLLAIGLYSGMLHDPDLIWGFMSKDLLFPGAIGLMLVGILAANMSTLDAGAVSYSALFIRNLYQPFWPNKSEKHYLLVGRVAIAVTLFGGIAVALLINNLLVLFKYIISIPAIFGASIWLGFLWRRLTKSAVFTQVVICLIIYAVIPNLFQTLTWSRHNPSFLLQTKPKTLTVTVSALKEDVEKGRAEYIGQSIKKEHTMEPVGIFFEQVARTDPADPSSPQEGLGRFHAEIWVLSWFGIDFSHCTKAQLVAIRFLFDALFPFLLLFLISFVTKSVPKPNLDRFFATLHTPVQETPEEEKAALEDSYRNPDKFEKDKLFPGSNWEILKPTRTDFLGFGGSWVLVGVIILLLWLMTSIQ